jgi:hypothetical protein
VRGVSLRRAESQAEGNPGGRFEFVTITPARQLCEKAEVALAREEKLYVVAI